MIKRISELTEADKERYLNNIKRDLEKTGKSWEFFENKIREDIDNTFDDERFLKMDPGFTIDAAYAREYFKWQEKHVKPSFMEYILWMGVFATGSDWISIDD